MPKVKTNNIETYYEMHGEGTPLVLIHGVGTCQKLWQPQIKQLSERFKVITYDVRGHGDSSGSDEKYSIQLFASDLKALLDNLGITKTHVCGLSMGGLIAQQFVLEHPGIVDRLILAGTFCHIDFRGRLTITLAKMLNRILLTFVSMETISRIGAQGMFKKEEQQELREFMINEVSKITKEEYFKVIDATYSFDSLQRLNEISCPTLILNAEGEKIERRQAEIMNREIRDSRKALITGAFHASNLEKPAEFNKLVLDFLSEE